MNAAAIWVALSAVVTPFVGNHLARRRVRAPHEDLATSLTDPGSAAALDL